MNPLHDPFFLFCAYHLGLDARVSGGKKIATPNLHSVARVFGVDVADVERALIVHGLDAATLLELDFDLVGAQMDIQVSPHGVDLLSLAQMHWDLFVGAAPKTRDWEKELEEDAQKNRRDFDR